VVTPTEHKKVGTPLCNVFNNDLYFVAFDNHSLSFQSALFRVFYPFTLQVPVKVITSLQQRLPCSR